MARLKTVIDGTTDGATDGASDAQAVDGVAGDAAPETAQGSAAPEEAGEAEAAAEPVSEGDATQAEPTVVTEPDPALPAPADGVAADDVPPVPLSPELVQAHAALDAAHAEYLAQSDKLAAANAQVVSLTEDLKDRDAQIDALTKTVAERDAQIAALNAAPPPPAAEATIKRPKVGKALKLPDEDQFAKWADVLADLDDGELLQVVLTDDSDLVQPFGPAIGGKAMFTVKESALLFAPQIALEPEMQAVTVRRAVLLDADGKVLSTCRFGALLIGGGGNSAAIPGNNVRFAFT